MMLRGAAFVARIALLAVVSCMACGSASAAARFAVASANWDRTVPSTIWSASSGGAAGASIPVAGDTVTIGETATPRVVTIPAGFAAAATSVTIGSAAQPGVSSLTLAAASSSLAVSGAVTINAPSNNNTTNALNAGAGAVTITGGLTLVGGGGNRNALLSISTGTTAVGGAVSVNNANAEVVFSGAGTLSTGGNFTNGGTFTSSSGTVIYNGAGAQNVGAYAYHHLTINKGGGTAVTTAVTTVAGNLAVSAGTFNVAGFDFTVTGASSVSGILGFTSTAGNKIFTGSVTINPGATWSNTSNEAITLNGNLTNNGTFSAGTGIYTFSGAAPQVITGTAAGTTTFGTLTLDNANGLTLGGTHNVTVNTLLTLTTGAVTTNANILFIANGSAIASAGGNDFVLGNLRKPFAVNAGAVARVFEVGTTATGSRFAPATLTFSNVTTAGNVTVSSTASSHPDLGNSGLDTATPHKLNRYWTVSNSGVVVASYSALFTFVAADVDTGANPLAFVATRFFPSAPAAGAWNPTTAAANTATSITLSGLTAFGDFAVGEPLGVNTGLGRFNAFESATPAGVFGVIKTQIAGSPFSLDIVALNGAALQNITATVTVALLDASDNSGALNAATNCRSSWTTLIVTAPVSVTTAFAAQNRRTTPSITVNNVFTDVRVRATNTAAGTVGCSSDRFAIKPSGITVSASDNNWTTAGAGRFLDNSGASGGNVHRAGQPFSVNALATPASATNYSGNPVIRTLVCVLPAGCSTGALTLGAWSGVSGSRTATANYSEAGTFRLQLEDQGFAVVDAADSTDAERFVLQTGGPGLFGRFVPDHFDVTVNNPVGIEPQFRTFGNACASRSFTYIGQSFGYVPARLPQALVTARNALGGTTLNYSGAFWKIAVKDVSQAYANTPVMALSTTLGAPTVTPTAGITGTGTVTSNAADTIAFVRSATTPQAQFSANLALTLSVSDATENGVNQGIIDSAAPAVFATLAFDAGNSFRYGRLRLQNANGSQLISMPIPIETQFWNGAAFITNAADNCTAIATANVALGNFTPGLAVADVTPLTVGGAFTAGVGALRLRAPGSGKRGSLDVSVNLTGGVAGASCSTVPPLPASTGSGLSWLQGAWCVAGLNPPPPNFDRDPTARATFGVYRNSDRFIYQRENF